MNKARSSLLLARAKARAYELFKNRQLPFVLVNAIDKLDPKDVELESKLKLLMGLTEHYLRLKGYYKKYPDAEQKANDDIKRILEKGGF